MTHIMQRRDTAANWLLTNPVLRLGEVGWDTTSNRAKRGDGVSHWDALPYSVSLSASDLATGTVPTARLAAATTTTVGVSRLATPAETIAGVANTIAVTPAGVQHITDTMLPSLLTTLAAVAPRRVRTGNYHMPDGLVDSTPSELVSGTVYFVPFVVQGATTVDAIAYRLSTLASGGAVTFSATLYGDTLDGGPDTANVIATTGTDALTAGVSKTLSLSATPGLVAGRYWVGVLYRETSAPSTKPQLHCIDRVSTIESDAALFTSHGAHPARCLVLTGQAALPTTATNPAPSRMAPPTIGLRRSA